MKVNYLILLDCSVGELIKIRLTEQEKIDKCPDNRVQLLANYVESKHINKEFAPKLMTNEEKIKT